MLWVFAYSVFELVDFTWTNPLMIFYLLAGIYSWLNVRTIFSWSWRAWSVLLTYRILTAFWALPPGWTSTSCGLVLCPGSSFPLFVLGQTAYTLMVFGFVNEGLRRPFVPRLGAYLARVSGKARGPGL